MNELIKIENHYLVSMEMRVIVSNSRIVNFKGNLSNSDWNIFLFVFVSIGKKIKGN